MATSSADGFSGESELVARQLAAAERIIETEAHRDRAQRPGLDRRARRLLVHPGDQRPRLVLPAKTEAPEDLVPAAGRDDSGGSAADRQATPRAATSAMLGGPVAGEDQVQPRVGQPPAAK